MMWRRCIGARAHMMTRRLGTSRRRCSREATTFEWIACAWQGNYSLPPGEMVLMAERWSRVHHSCRMDV